MKPNTEEEIYWPSDTHLFGCEEQALRDSLKSKYEDERFDPRKPSFNQCPAYTSTYKDQPDIQLDCIERFSNEFGRLSAIQHTRMLDKGFYRSFFEVRETLIRIAEYKFVVWLQRSNNPYLWTDEETSNAHIEYQKDQKNLLEYTTTFMLSKLCLIHEEISESVSALREDNKKDDKLPDRPGLEVELADAIIRILDFAGCFGLDIGGAIKEKLAFNLKRPEMHGKNA